MSEEIESAAALASDGDRQLASELVERAWAEGVELVGPGGLLTGLTKTVLETALEVELDEHLGYAKHARAPQEQTNARNGTRPKTVLTEVGEVEIAVPRDRDGSFAPAIVPKRQRRLRGVDELVISLSAKGLTTRRDQRPPGRRVRRVGQPGHHQPYHRPGVGRARRVAEPAVGRGLRRGLHRRHPSQDPRWAGGQPADLYRHRRHPRGRARDHRALGRRRLRRRQVLAP